MTENNPIVALSDDECRAQLRTQKVGRLVVRRSDDVDIFPINYVLDDGGESRAPSLIFRSAEGSKLFSVMVNEDVVFEVDDFDSDSAWSVIVRGKAEILQSNNEIYEAEKLPLKPFIPTLKYNFVRIVPESYSGRAFRLGEEPDRYAAGQY